MLALMFSPYLCETVKEYNNRETHTCSPIGVHDAKNMLPSFGSKKGTERENSQRLRQFR